MSAPELVLSFHCSDQVNVAFAGTESSSLPFVNPVTEKDRADIRWYVEIYGAHSLADPDDNEARRIEARLPEIGKALFQAAFGARAAQRLFDRYQDAEGQHRVLTIDSQSAAILSLPWELLHDPKGVYLFRENPHISVRRRISGATGGRSPFKLIPKQTLHLLFVVSRPSDTGFIDPRTDPKAVLDVLDQYAPGRVSVEFLRPATLNALRERLDDETKPAIDILHFDGHGVFTQVSEDDAEKAPDRYGKSILSEIHRERQARGMAGPAPVGIGFLAFENEDGGSQLISAQDLGDNLFRSRVGLVVLSACQSAALDSEGDPMASVAGRLTSTGISAILAMTHSVLVATTQALFGQFYQNLAKGRGIARSLDNARAWLANNPEKHEVQRGDQRRKLELQDWFIPALFHGGTDAPLLIAQIEVDTATMAATHNLRPAHEAGFFGRRRELWDIECWFASGKTRRISLTGFGGQGKTELAMEAGRWLLRTGLFRRAMFLDYAQVQSNDALGVAVSTLASVLNQTLSNADEVAEALKSAPTLIILDNLETIPSRDLLELLDAAQRWSEQGDTRILLTSRNPDFDHAGYPIEGSFAHRRIVLKGLGSAAQPEDALDWFVALNKMPVADNSQQVPPPRREELIELFDRVAFHPLSIAVLAQQLRTRSAKQLGQRLEQLLDDHAVSSAALEGTPPSLFASLRLSLDRLSEEQRQAVGRLGVFQGGAFEDDLLAITGLGEWRSDENERAQRKALLTAPGSSAPRRVLSQMSEELPEGEQVPPELLAQLQETPELEEQYQVLRAQLAERPTSPSTPDPWPALRLQLEAAALIEAERVPSVAPPFLRFHPTLAPMLWAGLSQEEQTSLSQAHRQRYYTMAGYLLYEDSKSPDHARAIAKRELPNLLHAVDQALKTGDEQAAHFVNSVNRFLKLFGRSREATALSFRAEQLGDKPGSTAWYLAQANRGEQLLASGQATKAAECFSAILTTLGETPSYKLAVMLGRLGRCDAAKGRPDLAEAKYRRGIAVTETLEQGDDVKRLCGNLCSELGDVLRVQGRYAEAREQYQDCLKLQKEVNNLRGQGVAEGQLGTLALTKGDLAEAKRRHQEALKLFQRLGEPEMEAVAMHQLGLAFQDDQQWEQAEQYFRKSAALKEKHGNLAGAAGTWSQLALVCVNSGRLEAAETWFRKAINGSKATGDTANVAKMLNNLANFLQDKLGRHEEACRLAEEALTIKKTMDPCAAQIWTTYGILAVIADKQSRPEDACGYRRLAREAKSRFAGTAHEMKRHLPLIIGILEALKEPGEVEAFDSVLSSMEEHGWTQLAVAIRKLLSGERDADVLCGPLDIEDFMIIESILRALEDPSSLEGLLQNAEDDE